MTKEQALKLNIGDTVEYGIKSIKRTLTVTNSKDVWLYYRPNEKVTEFGYISLKGDRDNNNYFIWLENAYPYII